MTKNILKSMICSMVFLFTITACQDIKDTYADFAGNGEIRYVGKCDDLTVTPGWKRLIVNWTNNVDPIISKVKVKWSNDKTADSVLLDRGVHTYSISNLVNETYKIEVSSLDEKGQSSLSTTIYGRPYTLEHEEIISFTRIIAKQYFFGNHLILQFAGWQNGIENAYLQYTKKDGTVGKLDIDEYLTDESLYVLPDEIDPSKPVTLYRTGRISDCPDLITFDPYELSHQKTYTADFKNFIQQKYGTNSHQMLFNGIINDDWANEVSTIELDADMDSFEDLLNLPNIKKLTLGKNTYLTARGAEDATRGQYQLYNLSLSKKVLNFLHDENGLTVERYNKHYKKLKKLSYLKEMGEAKLPELKLFDLSQAKITVAPTDEEGFNSHPEFLIDGKLTSCWKPLPTSNMKTYVFNIDLGKEVEANGFKIVQKDFGEYDEDNDIAPQRVNIEYADKNGSFEDASFEHDIYIGTSTGQTMLIPIKGGRHKVRYIQLSIPAQYYHGTYQVTLAEFGLY